MFLFSAIEPVCCLGSSPHCRIKSLCFLHFSNTRLTAIHLSKDIFFLGVARAICLAPFNRTFSSPTYSLNGQCHPSLLLLQAILVKLLIAAYAKWGIYLFVVWLEMLHIWVWGDSCFAKAVSEPSLGGKHKLCTPVLVTGLLWAKSKPCSYFWHWNKAVNCVEDTVCCAGLGAVLTWSQLSTGSEHKCGACIVCQRLCRRCFCVEFLKAEWEQGQGRFSKHWKHAKASAAHSEKKFNALMLLHAGDGCLKNHLVLGRMQFLFLCYKGAGFQDFSLKSHGEETCFQVASFLMKAEITSRNTCMRTASPSIAVEVWRTCPE